MTELLTPRLRLRPASLDDLGAMHAIMCEPRAMRYWSTPPHDSLEQTRLWLQSMVEIRVDEGEDFVVEHEGRVVGKAGLYSFPEIGFIFHPDVWGRGFAREALDAVIRRGLVVHRLRVIEADVDPRNTASLRLLAGLGFVVLRRAARTWQVGSEWCDSVYLGLNEASYQAATAARESKSLDEAAGLADTAR
jgi:RimJ/RimL family protein N-acetyltransferase